MSSLTNSVDELVKSSSAQQTTNQMIKLIIQRIKPLRKDAPVVEEVPQSTAQPLTPFERIREKQKQLSNK